MSDSGLLRFESRESASAPGARARRASDSVARVSDDPHASLAYAAAHGDVRATEALLRAIAPSLVRVARAVLGPRDPELDDAVQESLLAFVDALAVFEGRSSVLRYASRITVRLCIDRRRRSRLRRSRMPLSDDLDSNIADRADPGAEREQATRREALRLLLEELPEVQAETVALRFCLGMSLEEVAHLTDAPVNTVRSRVRLARTTLKHRIESDPALIELLGEGA